MLPEGSIAADRIWKRFRPDRTGSMMRAEYERLVARVTGRDLNWTWALTDVSLKAEPGESIGLVGDNGSGKSTLLKIIGGVMYPYAGRIETVGRIGALIEVRAGISPDLTGRENINLYGTLLGLTRQEVASRFDEIVSFAGLERAVDRQVKYYSSGMQMRLGFSVAAFLEPAILLVDEVLAVGDASFQQRCLERMRAVINQGTTVVFVSHDLASVGSICTRGIWVNEGVAAAEGTMADILAAYRGYVDESAEQVMETGGKVRIVKTELINPESAVPGTQQPLEIRMLIETDVGRGCNTFLGVTEGTSDPIFVVRQYFTLKPGLNEIRCTLPHLPLPRGRFYLWMAGLDHLNWNEELLPWHPVMYFDVFGPDLDQPPKAVVLRAPVHVPVSWDFSEVSGSETADSNGESTDGSEVDEQEAGRAGRRS